MADLEAFRPVDLDKLEALQNQALDNKKKQQQSHRLRQQHSLAK